MTPAEFTLDLCDRIAAHSDVSDAIDRSFLSPATKAVHALLRDEMEGLGMTVRVDSAGNVRGVYAATSANAPILLTGSHIDTVPDAGRFDGILGVALPIALIRALNGQRLPYAIEVVAFSEEEGVRFKFPFIGSKALVADLTPEDLARTDANGISIAQALRDFGLDPDRLSDALLTPSTFAFFEAHIEQGPVLEALNLPLGIVTTIIGQSRLGLTFNGQANHAGTTPMSFRRDALAAAAQWISEVEAYPTHDPELLATVGAIQVQPGAANVIPGAVTVSLDVRHPADEARLNAVANLLAKAKAIAESRGLTLAIVDRGAQASVPMDPTLRESLTLASAPFGPLAMPSGAGHDAMILARQIPTAMLFLRTPDGLSHHPKEAVSVHDVEVAIKACLTFLHSLKPTGL